jgi:outer membrane immunogenic protein
MRKIGWLTLGALLLAMPAVAQDTPQAELSAGYSFLRISESGSSSNFHGGSASIAGNVNNWFGVVFDAGGYHTNESGVSGHVFSYMFGPRISYRSSSRLTPFGQVLLGGARATASGGGASGSLNSFAAGVGGGLDVKATERIAIRVVQAEYIFTHFAGVRQNNARVSAGVVFRFGRR